MSIFVEASSRNFPVSKSIFLLQTPFWRGLTTAICAYPKPTVIVMVYIEKGFEFKGITTGSAWSNWLPSRRRCLMPCAGGSQQLRLMSPEGRWFGPRGAIAAISKQGQVTREFSLIFFNIWFVFAFQEPDGLVELACGVTWWSYLVELPGGATWWS